VLKVSDVNKLIVPVFENNEIKYYVNNEELFDVIHKVHLSIGNGGRNRMEYEINTKYKNITRDMIMLYLNSCESCKRKGSTVKKGLVVQLIISTVMNLSMI
jgi:hypothetical protein